ITAPGDEVVLAARIAPDLSPWLAVDAVRLRQVLGNLVGNAVKFTARGRVELSVEVLGGDAVSQRLALVVTDTGVGISAEDQARLFAPFEQVGAAGAVGRAGTGLGLVICRQLVEAMGGTITLASELGRGTKLLVELALPIVAAPADGGADADRGVARRSLPAREQAEREGSLLLLVEDHPVNREILARQLQTLGFVTDTAGDADEALARFERRPHGLVFTDIQLPGADGYELARRLRTAEARLGRPRRPIIALTANALRGARERCVDAGMDDLVVKPATLGTLAATLRRWLPNVGWPGAPPAAPGDEAPFDASALAELTGGDAELERHILASFARSLHDDLPALAQAQADGDLERIRRLAHQIAGAARTVGAHALAATASRVERAAIEAGDSAELEGLAGEASAHALSG
ncbi:MAG TPA: ATP-binding protein, partial [Solirubrobacteraceae bacterium]|nr:ATP-binding protein [Solirubrobacteraceae bacterium]